MKSVLIVDDDPALGRLLDIAFKQAGFAVRVAHDGKRGLEMAVQDPPDVAILDVMMPGVHGYELCRRLRADSRTAGIKIVFLTARSQPIDREEGLKAGADLFLSKPIMPDELMRHIEGLLTPQEKELASAEHTTASGRLIACFSLHHGVGVTTVATNLSLALALYLRTPVSLIEAHATPADVLPIMGIRPTSPETTGVLKHPLGVHIMLSPAIPSLTPLRVRYPFVLADVSSKPDDRGWAVLKAADLVFLVTTPDTMAVQLAQRAMRALNALHVPTRRIMLIVNHVTPHGRVPAARVQEWVGRPVSAIIPYEASMQELVRAGQPLLAARPRSPASKVIARLAEQLAGPRK